MPAPTQQQLMEQLVQLTDAVKALAHRQVGHPATQDADFATVTDDDRIRQRVAFSYQALGALTGRVSSSTSREFDVRVVDSRREPGAVVFRRLPADADWVELRRGTTVETLRIRRDHDDDGGGNGGDDGGVDVQTDAGRRERRRRGRVHPDPDLFPDTQPIGSIVFLRGRLGPLVAFGPRLPALPAAPAAGGVPATTGSTPAPADITPGA